MIPDAEGEESATTLTSGDGNYTFSGIVAGSYTIIETDPDGFTSVTNNSVVVILSGNASANVNFADQAQGTLSGVVFNDLNGDGNQDENELGLGGVSVALMDTSRQVLSTIVTAGNGVYIFTGQDSGSYIIQETDPDGYFSTTLNEVLITLIAGGSNAVNFGDQIKGSISGVVFSDFDGDGLQDGNEQGIGGVTITLSATDAEDIVATTTGDGSYSFSGLASQNYTITETDPDGVISITPNTISLTISDDNPSETVNFADQPKGVIAGIVFEDLNGNGVQDASEGGVSGVTIEITGTESRTTTTSGDGTYQETGIAAGSYVITETDLTGFVSTTPNQVTLTLNADNSASANFGDQKIGVISGVVFSDFNGNGQQDENELGLGGIEITLKGTSTEVTQTTSGDGSYQFVNVTSGNYTVIETDPEGYISTTMNEVRVNLSDDSSASANFGDQIQGIISGTVFEDFNGNGSQDSGEEGLGGVLITLNGDTAVETRTSGTGEYAFVGLTPGAYTVVETDPEGYLSVTSNTGFANLNENSSVNLNFADQQEGTVSGYVFDDRNGDGVQGSSELGIRGVTIQLNNSAGEEIGNATSSGDGSYQFSGIAAGSYFVLETDPAGYSSTTSNEVSITLGTGGATSANFGDQLSGMISGTVFDDFNGDSDQDPNDSGISGVTVTLTNSNGRRNGYDNVD